MTIKAKVPRPTAGHLEGGKIPLISQGNGKLRVLSKEDQSFMNYYQAVEENGMFDRLIKEMKELGMSKELIEMCEVVLADMRANKNLERKKKSFHFFEVLIGYYAGKAKEIVLP